MMTVIFIWAAYKTDFFPIQRTFGVSSLQKRIEMTGEILQTIYLQVSTISQALIFVTRARSWSYVERPGLLLVAAFVIAQLIAFTRKKERKNVYLKWAHAQMTLQGLQPPDSKMFSERNSFTELNLMAEEAKRRAEIARLYNDCNHACHDDKLVLILAASSVFILLPVDGILSTFL
ncbi:hypothetical protein ACOSP7_029001 [Xanthoceras sorbifolium]